MTKIKIGVVGPSDIGYRRFVPALEADENFEYVGVAIANPNEWFPRDDGQKEVNDSELYHNRARTYVDRFGGVIFNSYEELLSSANIDAVYIPLPPALHFQWAAKALEYGKHVMLEKPFTTNIHDTNKLIELARQKGIVLHENYAFCYHQQMTKIIQLIETSDIGEMRLIRAAFGFPYRSSNDFRYNKELGGGALLDCGGYPVKIASNLLGDSVKVTSAALSTLKGHNVDVFGSAMLENDEKLVGQIAFGMDNAYKCELEIWGSKGCIFAPRIFTAPADFRAMVTVKKQDEIVFEIPADDQFLGSIKHFYKCMHDDNLRIKTYLDITLQSKLIDDIGRIGEGVIYDGTDYSGS